MPSFAVIVTTTLTPPIQVQLSGNVTYQQFKNSLGQFVYKVEKVYLFSENLRQIQGLFNYNSYDSNGNQVFTNVVSAIDPYQDQPAIILNIKDRGIVIDGQDAVQFNLQPNTQLTFKLYVDRRSNQDYLDELHANNFVDLNRELADPEFFDDYLDYI